MTLNPSLNSFQSPKDKDSLFLKKGNQESLEKILGTMRQGRVSTLLSQRASFVDPKYKNSYALAQNYAATLPPAFNHLKVQEAAFAFFKKKQDEGEEVIQVGQMIKVGKKKSYHKWQDLFPEIVPYFDEELKEELSQAPDINTLLADDSVQKPIQKRVEDELAASKSPETLSVSSPVKKAEKSMISKALGGFWGVVATVFVFATGVSVGEEKKEPIVTQQAREASQSAEQTLGKDPNAKKSQLQSIYQQSS